MKNYYHAGLCTASLEQISARKYHVVILYEGKRIEHTFRKEVDALNEILSYAEIFSYWFEEEERKTTS